VSGAIDPEGFAFFDGLSGRLHIELTEPAQRVSPRLYNVAAPPAARIVSIRLELEVFEDDEFRGLTEEEWNRVVLRVPRLRARSAGADVVVTHDAPDGAAFTVRDLAVVIAKTEHVSREQRPWLGGVDVHHVFFEGVTLRDGIWESHWGS
jgi:hypothetical protein